MSFVGTPGGQVLGPVFTPRHRGSGLLASPAGPTLASGGFALRASLPVRHQAPKYSPLYWWLVTAVCALRRDCGALCRYTAPRTPSTPAWQGRITKQGKTELLNRQRLSQGMLPP